MYPKLWIHSGLPYAELIDRLVALALERHDPPPPQHRPLTAPILVCVTISGRPSEIVTQTWVGAIARLGGEITWWGGRGVQ